MTLGLLSFAIVPNAPPPPSTVRAAASELETARKEFGEAATKVMTAMEHVIAATPGVQADLLPQVSAAIISEIPTGNRWPGRSCPGICGGN